MEFQIDKDLRRRISFKIIGATTGGKIALTLCSICTVLFFVSLYPFIYYLDYEPNTDEAIKWACAMMAVGIFLMAGPVGLACTYRQRNLRVAMRTHERLLLENGWLRYSFHLSNDTNINGLSDFAINLRESSLQLGPNGECVFTGGVFSWDYQNVVTDIPRSPAEMRSIPSFEIWPYWSPDLYETLVAEQQRLASG